MILLPHDLNLLTTNQLLNTLDSQGLLRYVLLGKGFYHLLIGLFHLGLDRMGLSLIE